MNCQDTEQMIHAYADQELDPVQSLAVEQHLENCPNCARLRQQIQTLASAITERNLYFEAPKELKKRVRSVVRQANGSEARNQPRQRNWSLPWTSILAPFAAVALLILSLSPLVTRHFANSGLTEEIVSAHVRSLMVDHKTDVPSSDQHTVKPWFDGKLDFAPPVVDLTDHGFPLVGGRLDYVHGRAVAALVYQRNLHFINVFVWPAADNGSTSRSTTTLQGYNQVHWQSGGMTFWAISDLNLSELADLAQRLK